MAVENNAAAQPHNKTPGAQRFDLVRYFFWLSLVLMGVATLAMAGYLRYFSSEQMLQLEKSPRRIPGPGFLKTHCGRTSSR